MTHTKESISRELKSIQDRVPTLFKTLLFIETEKTPIVKLMAEKALLDDDFPQEKKARIQTLLDSGTLSKKTVIENPKVAKQRDIWVQKEIKRSVAAGRLPTKKQLKELKIEHYGY